MGITGLCFVGPQNYALRVIKERREGKEEEFDFDTKVRKKRREKTASEEEGYIPYFSSYAPDNRLIRQEQIDKSDFKEVAVPSTPLSNCYRRFYDWPPEPEYARVTKSKPPKNDFTAEQLLEDDDFELYDGDCEYADDESLLKDVTWGSRAKYRAKGFAKTTARVIPGLKNRKKRMESIEESVRSYPSYDQGI